jgi:GDPmannose 4,6-dehydratase
VRKALITGITGQDGSYLAELLLSKGYEVYGLARRVSVPNQYRLQDAYNIAEGKLTVLQGDVTDASSIFSIVNEVRPDEIYNLAAQSQVGVSFKAPQNSFDTIVSGTLNLLEAIRTLHLPAKFYQASSSEMFGASLGTLYGSPPPEANNFEKGNAHYRQDENTPFKPNSPYAAAKLASHNLLRIYRDSYDIFACGGILFNHESERRGEDFVTRKITKYLAKLHCLARTKAFHKALRCSLGNIEARRDWGHAQDYVYAMWLMLQQAQPDDYVVGTGTTHSVKEFYEEAFKHITIPHLKVEDTYYIDKDLLRPNDVPYLRANPKKAFDKLGWRVRISFSELVRKMVTHDIKLFKKENPELCPIA